MKKSLGKFAGVFYKIPILTTLALAFVLALLVWILISVLRIFGGTFFFDFYYVEILLLFFSFLPLTLTLENILFLFVKPTSGKKATAIKKLEVFLLAAESLYLPIYIDMTNIVFRDWNAQLYNSEVHTPLSMKHFPAFLALALLALVGYACVRFMQLDKLPPLAVVILISAIYLGVGLCVLWCVQIFDTSAKYLHLSLFPFNFIIIALRTVRDAVRQGREASGETGDRKKFRAMSRLLDNSLNWPWLAFIAAIPLLGLLSMFLLIFGQEPDSIIKVWTETAEWNMSQKTAPPNITKDMHYLCTVAAGGHAKIVKPIRTGQRRGNTVIVNRQLCVANAFEQLIEERMPRFHRLVRGVYDRSGYPIAKHISSPRAADAVYFLMKPLEWLFLIVLYLFDARPENRIAVQYPHSVPPGIR